jgi:amphi-Trp domain-containing protein
MWTMADVKLERKESLSREEAAQWLLVLSKAFARGGDVTLPLGAGTVELRLPDRVRAEFEVEVSGDEVEIELEFTWSTARLAREAVEEGASVSGVASGPE